MNCTNIQFMEDDSLTPRQRQILDWIAEQSASGGAPPTRAEIASAFGFRSANAAEEHLRALARKGAIEMTPGRSRGIRVVGARTRQPDGALLPLIGRVAAGSPILAVENIESELAVDAALFQPHADYLLRVRGDSMVGVGILDGDLLAVHRQAPATRWRSCALVRRESGVRADRNRSGAGGFRAGRIGGGRSAGVGGVGRNPRPKDDGNAEVHSRGFRRPHGGGFRTVRRVRDPPYPILPRLVAAPETPLSSL